MNKGDDEDEKSDQSDKLSKDDLDLIIADYDRLVYLKGFLF